MDCVQTCHSMRCYQWQLLQAPLHTSQPEQGDKPQDQPQPRPNQLSKQQVENLLRAMQNAEKQVQEKVDAKKEQGAKVKTEKDW